MRAKPIPDGYDSLIPSKIVRNAAKAIEFYKDVFGATEAVRMNCPETGKVAHAELKIRSHVLMLGDESPEMGMLAPAEDGKMPSSSTFIYVQDVDGTYDKALASGARAVMPPADMFWGDRYAKFLDPYGHLWGIATHTRDVTPEECDKGMEEWMKQRPQADSAA